MSQPHPLTRLPVWGQRSFWRDSLATGSLHLIYLCLNGHSDDRQKWRGLGGEDEMKMKRNTDSESEEEEEERGND